jgi:hypothetical protein
VKNWMRGLRAIGVAACVSALAACGGGGGGGDDIEVSVDKTSLAFAGFVDVPYGSESLTFTLVKGEGEFYGMVELDRSDAFYTPSLNFSDTSATLYLTPINSAPEKTSGAIVLKLCRDAYCRDVAWQRSIPYTKSVYQLQANAVGIDAFEGTAGGEARVAVLPAGSAADLTMTVADEHLYGPAPWLDAHADGNDIVVTASSTGMAQGTYDRSLDIRVKGSMQGGSTGLGVTLTVGSGIVTPPASTLEQRVDTAVGAVAGSVPLAFNGGLSPAWTASSSAPWLLLDSTSGVGSGELRFHADAAVLATEAPWADLTAQIDVTPAGLAPTSVQLTLQRRLPHLTWVHPASVASGSATSVKVYGRGFSQLGGIGSLQAPGLQVTGGAIESDTVMRLDLGATAAGAYSLSIANASAQATARATLSSQANAGAASAFVAYAGNKRTAVFDDSRQAVFAIGNEDEMLIRFKQVSGSWQTAALWVPFVNSLALGPDRSTVYATVGDDEVVEIDADSLTIRARYTAENLSSMRETSSRTIPLPITRDGKLWVNHTGGYFDIVAKRFGHSEEVLEAHRAQQTSEHAPADGSRLFLAGLSNFGEFGIYFADSGTVQRAPTMPQIYESASLSADGAKLLADNNTLYRSSDWAALGDASGTQTGQNGWRAGVLSRDGLRVYRVATEGDYSSQEAKRIDVFDATRRVQGSSQLVKIGSIPLTTAATCDSWPGDWCDVMGALRIDALGTTLYWTGSYGMAVLPIPPELRVAAAPRTVLRPAAR